MVSEINMGIAPACRPVCRHAAPRGRCWAGYSCLVNPIAGLDEMEAPLILALHLLQHASGAGGASKTAESARGASRRGAGDRPRLARLLYLTLVDHAEGVDGGAFANEGCRWSGHGSTVIGKGLVRMRPRPSGSADCRRVGWDLAESGEVDGFDVLGRNAAGAKTLVMRMVRRR